MATESMVFQQEYEETRGTDRKNYDYTSVQTQYDPGYIHEEAGFQHTKRNENNSKDGAKYDYKPTALRLWFLLLAAAFLLGCIAAAEYALRTEPSASQVYQNTTFSRRGGPAVPAKGWLGAAWGNNLAPDGMPRARGMARMDRVDLRVVERVPGSTNYMPSGLTTVRVTRAPVTSRQSQTKEISTSVTVTTERVVSVTVTLPAATSNVGEPGTTTGKVHLAVRRVRISCLIQNYNRYVAVGNFSAAYQPYPSPGDYTDNFGGQYNHHTRNHNPDFRHDDR